MADLVITGANVKCSAKAIKKDGIAGATITAGQVLFLDPADNKLKLAKASNATAAAGRIVEGIALDGAADGQPLKYVTSDPALVVGATLVVGTTYILSSATAGSIAPDTDAVSGDWVTDLGVAESTTALNFNPNAAGAPKA